MDIHVPILQPTVDDQLSERAPAIRVLRTERTVESYRARIMVKLDLHSTAALVRYAIRQKIVEA